MYSLNPDGNTPVPIFKARDIMTAMKNNSFRYGYKKNEACIRMGNQISVPKSIYLWYGNNKHGRIICGCAQVGYKGLTGREFTNETHMGDIVNLLGIMGFDFETEAYLGVSDNIFTEAA